MPMWFLLSLLALSMLVARRSADKHAASHISSLGMAWLQQAVALPFIVLSLVFARFYWPSELSTNFWLWMSLYVVLISLDALCYYKALSMADVSYIAPLMSLTAIGNIVGAYFVLGQVPTVYGFMGAGLIVAGAAITYSAKRRDEANKRANKLALLLVLLIVAERGFNSNMEVFMLRESNPTTFNFYSSLLTVPFILVASLVIVRTSRSGKYQDYWKKLKSGITKHQWLLVFIALTYTVNMLATYQAKLIGPNAGYVGAIKGASVLPMMLIGVFLFREKILPKQWAGLGLVLLGLVLMAFN